MNILYITYEVPTLDGTGSNVRDFNLLYRLADEHQFTVICYQDKNLQKSGEKTKQLLGFCNDVITFPQKDWVKNEWASRIDTILRMPNPYPWCVRDACSFEMRTAVLKLLTNKCFDIIHVNSVELSTLLFLEGQVKRVIGIESISQREKRLLYKRTGLVTRVYHYSEWIKLRWYEKKLYRSADLCTMASDVEKQRVLEYAPRANVVIIPNGVDVYRFIFRPVDRPRLHELKLLFFGAMNYPPNEDAVLYFHKEIWPLLKKEFPGCTWQVVGPNPSPSVQALASDDFEVLGWVNDIQEVMAHSSLMIVPLRSGGGTRIKILEAMAAGLPVISTFIGAEGLKVSHGENILLADTPQDFCNAVEKLLNHPEYALDLTFNARHLVEREYGWDRIAHNLDDAYKAL